MGCFATKSLRITTAYIVGGCFNQGPGSYADINIQAALENYVAGRST
jgi:hypothetical protein